MSVTRPHEDRLGTSGTTGYVLEYSGTGTAEWVTPPPSGITPNAITAECNSPTTGGDANLPFDTFYDQDDNVISGGALTAALAAIGLTYSGGVFTSTTAGVFALELNFSPITAPALQLSSITLVSSISFAVPGTRWGTGSTEGNPPDWNAIVVPFVFYSPVSATFYAQTTRSGTTSAGIITYASMAIIKLA